MDKKTEAFISFVKEECKKNSVIFKPYKRSYIKLTDDIKCGGFFDDGSDPKLRKATLAFAQGREDFIELMVHEYCHMTQWIDGIELWDVSADSLTVVDEWLSGVDRPDELVEVSLNNSRELELDNEKRSVQMFKKWDLPVDTALYTKKANAYVLFYNYMKISRKWSNPDNVPYRNKNILEAMSDKFDMDYENLSEELIELFKKEKI
jgi:hypothetical protein